jgi:hypothetical protein
VSPSGNLNSPQKVVAQGKLSSDGALDLRAATESASRPGDLGTSRRGAALWRLVGAGAAGRRRAARRAGRRAEAVPRGTADRPGPRTGAHSNAGLYVPELTRKRRVIGYVFVDAILPPNGGTVPVAPQHLVTELESLADESGMLPPWTAWWGDDDLRGLYPDPDTRGRIEEQAPRIPVRYLRSTISLPVNWNRYPGAYSPSATPMPKIGPPL